MAIAMRHLILLSTFCTLSLDAFVVPAFLARCSESPFSSSSLVCPRFMSSIPSGSFSSANFFGQTTTKTKPVDMNSYNLPFEKTVEEWTANVRADSDQLAGGGVFLGAKSNKEIMVDSFQVRIPRKIDEGLGILLEEIAGGRGDGVGITIVSGLVQGGVSEKSGILEGDSVSKIAIVEHETGEEVAAVGTECFDYDATVDSILSLPAASDTTKEDFVLTIKRLRRKPRVKLTIQYPPTRKEEDTTLELFSGEKLRRAMLTRGVKLNDPFARRFDSGGSGDCGAEGTCATCVVSVLKGGELLNPQSVQEEQMLRNKPRWRLGCKAVVGYGFQEGEIVIRVNPKQFDDGK